MKFVTFQNEKNSQPRFGFVDFAERWNGRLAILGIVICLIQEFLTGEGLVEQISIRFIS